MMATRWTESKKKKVVKRVVQAIETIQAQYNNHAPETKLIDASSYQQQIDAAIEGHKKLADDIKEMDKPIAVISDPVWQAKIQGYKAELLKVSQSPSDHVNNQNLLENLSAAINQELKVISSKKSIPAEYKSDEFLEKLLLWFEHEAQSHLYNNKILSISLEMMKSLEDPGRSHLPALNRK
jgi:hypothetical protein